jgi:hypothetical protein
MKKYKSILLGSFVLAFSFLQMGCTAQDLNKNNDTVDKASTYSLVETRQRVIRYNCLSEVLSDKVETIKAPTARISIKPKIYTGLYTSSIGNATLRKQAGSITNFTDFTIDRNPGALNLEVQVGSNEITYNFFYCDQLVVNPDQSQSCKTTPESRESGSIFINVTYENQDLTGFSEVHPDPQSCK